MINTNTNAVSTNPQGARKRTHRPKRSNANDHGRNTLLPCAFKCRCFVQESTQSNASMRTWVCCGHKELFRDEPSRTAILGCSTSQKQVARTGGPRFLKASSLQNSRNSASLLAAIWWISLLQQVFQAFLGEDIRFEVQRPERRKTVRSPARRRTRRTWGTRWCTFLSPTCDFKLCPRNGS